MILFFLLSLCFTYSRSKSFYVQAPPHTVIKRETLGPGNNVQISKIDIFSEIQYRYSRTTIETCFKNYGQEANIAEFNAILPDTAFISNFSMTIQDIEYVAEVMPKEEAKKTFNQQRKSGSGAGLVEQDFRDKNVFVISANVEAGGKVLFRLTYDELLERRQGFYEQVINVKPGQIVDDFNIVVYIDESLPIKSLSVPEVKSNTLEPANNTLAKITKDIDGDSSKAMININLSKTEQAVMGENGIEEDFIVKYDVERKHNNEVQVIDGHFVHFFAPENLEVLPKHVIFVLDVSGSMTGEKMKQLKDAMFTILDEMSEEDSFEIITFSTTVAHWKSRENYSFGVIQASGVNKLKAIDHILQLKASGGTNIDGALEKALELCKSLRESKALGSEVQTMLLFLTDGQPTVGRVDHQEIKEHIRTLNLESEIPIYTLAFGSDADFDLMISIAEDSGSRAKQIYEGSDAALQLEGFYKEIASPLLSDLEFDYVGAAVDENTLTDTHLKTFFQGSEYIVAGKIIPNEGNFTISINCIGQDSVNEVLTVPSTPTVRSEAQNFLQKLYAFLTIKQLLLKEDGQTKALEMSLENNFVTKLTSLIVKKGNNNKEAAFILDKKPKIRNYSSGMTARSGSGVPRRKQPQFFAGNPSKGGSSHQVYKPQFNMAIGVQHSGGSSSGVPRSGGSSSGVPRSGGSSYDYALNNYNYNYNNNFDNQYQDYDYYGGRNSPISTTTTTTETPKSCFGKLALYPKTYQRGESHEITDTSDNLNSFNNKAVSALVDGNCCWRVYANINFSGASLLLGPGQDYNSVTSLHALFRGIKSVQRVIC